MKNAFSVDLEDWYCVHNLIDHIPYEMWKHCEPRIETTAKRLLDILERHRVKATFFVLGWIAERHPGLIKAIAAEGHEIATHGFRHMIIKDSNEHEFEKDLQLSLATLKQCVGTPIRGFRAPSFSIQLSKPWIFSVLKRNGIRYDSSAFPIHFHPDYGMDPVSTSIHEIADSIIEFPMTCFKVLGFSLPCCGGGYFRFFPYGYTAYGIRNANKKRVPAVFYIHPWEIDTGQPRIKGISYLKRLRHYCNIEKTESRLRRLVSEFEFTTIADVLGLPENENSEFKRKDDI